MNIKQLLARLSENWPAKAVCFILAGAIYFFHQMSLLETKTFTVPLEVNSDGLMITALSVESKKYIRIKVRGEREDLSSISDMDFKAYTNISGKDEEGTYDFPVYAELSERIIRMNIDPLEISVQPEFVKLPIQKKAYKAVPVVATVTGKPAYGYKAVHEKCEPGYFMISGPASVVEEITGIPTAIVDVDGSKKTVVKTVSLVPMTSAIRIEDKDSVKVTVPVVKEGMVKDFSLVQVEYVNVPEGLAVTGDVPAIDISIEGSVLDLERLKASSIKVYADCSSVTGEGQYVVPVRVDVSSLFSVVYKSREELNVTVVIKESQGTENNMEGHDDSAGENGSQVTLQKGPEVS